MILGTVIASNHENVLRRKYDKEGHNSFIFNANTAFSN